MFRYFVFRKEIKILIFINCLWQQKYYVNFGYGLFSLCSTTTETYYLLDYKLNIHRSIISWRPSSACTPVFHGIAISEVPVLTFLFCLRSRPEIVFVVLSLKKYGLFIVRYHVFKCSLILGKRHRALHKF